MTKYIQMEMENSSKYSIACPLCHGTQVLTQRAVGMYKILKCKECGVFFADPMKSMDYENKELEGKDFENAFKRSLRRNFVYCLGVSFLSQLKGKNILDIGGGQGLFLRHAKDLGYECHGTEVSEKCIKLLGKNAPFAKIWKSSMLENLPQSWPRFTVISCLDVLEHAEKPALLMDGIAKNLDKNGFLILSLPNINRYYYKFFKFFDDFVPMEHGGDNPPYHLTFWSKKAVEKLIKRAGFRNFEIIEAGLLWRKNIYVKGRYSKVLSKLMLITYKLSSRLPIFLIRLIEKLGPHLIVFATLSEDGENFKKIVKEAVKKTYKKQTPFFVEGGIE